MISVLLVGFNRPDLLRRSLDSLMVFEESFELFIHLDGPRNEVEAELTRACHEVINYFIGVGKISITSEVHDQNLGCKRAMRCALDWFFLQREKGLILEDDIVLLPGALQVTELLLNQFDSDKSICQISLSNQLAVNYGSKVSYFYSNYPFIWGWATWRDRWMQNISEISTQIKTFQSSKEALKIRAEVGRGAFRYWINRFHVSCQSDIDTWDFQWHFSNWFYGKKSIHLDRNFATNIGFDNRATHTKIPLKRDLINLRQLEIPRSSIESIEKSFLYKPFWMDRRISSRIFGVPHWFFHPLKYVKIWSLKFYALISL